MAQHDLIPRLSPYLDQHLVIPLLDFEIERELYDENQVLTAKYEMFRQTKMVDFANELWKKLHPDQGDMQDYETLRSQALSQFATLTAEITRLTSLLLSENVIQSLKQDKEWNQQWLQETHGVDKAEIQKLYEFAKLKFDLGSYGEAGEALYHFRVLSTDQTLLTSSLWGKLACSILTADWDNALSDLRNLGDHIDSSFSSPTLKLLHRSHLIHYSLFVFFNHPRGKDLILDWFFDPKYLMTIQKECPWILRYLTTAVVTNKKRKMMKELVKVLENERYQYEDPVTQFVLSLYSDVDFEVARSKLKECSEVLSNDFFLVATLEDFLDNARLLIFETYCRIYQDIHIPSLSEFLNLPPSSGEKWIVNLIRSARLDAKIDSVGNKVIMGQMSNRDSVVGKDKDRDQVIRETVYQSVIEKTRALTFRTSVVVNNIERREQGEAQGQNTQRNQGQGQVQGQVQQRGFGYGYQRGGQQQRK